MVWLRLAPLVVVAGLCVTGAAAASPEWFVAPRADASCFVSTIGNKLLCRRGKLRVSIAATGRARRGWPRRYTQPPPIAPEFLYRGNEWSDGDFTCVVRATGLTCRNRSRHGWTIARSDYRLF